MKSLKRKIKSLIQPFIDRWSISKRTEFYRQFVGEGHLFFDVGANIGNRTEVFRRLGVRVVAVEPQSACAAVLEKKFARDPDVVVVNMGLGSEEGEKVMHVCTSANTLSTFSADWERGRFSNESFDREERISMTTLGALIKTYGVPDFCKIDVEGYELEVLSGLSTKIPCLSFEFTSECILRAEQILNLLTNLGFREFSFALGEDMSLVGGWVSEGTLVGSLRRAIEADGLAWGDVYAR